jgi:hypothetical protein
MSRAALIANLRREIAFMELHDAIVDRERRRLFAIPGDGHDLRPASGQASARPVPRPSIVRHLRAGA